MAASNKISPCINKQKIVLGNTFGTHNFISPLCHQEIPSEFHVIQDFLTLSAIGYALTNPVKVSYKTVLQVWNTAKVDAQTTQKVLANTDVVPSVNLDAMEQGQSHPVSNPSIPLKQKTKHLTKHSSTFDAS